jgi:hypothetical protein
VSNELLLPLLFNFVVDNENSNKKFKVKTQYYGDRCRLLDSWYLNGLEIYNLEHQSQLSTHQSLYFFDQDRLEDNGDVAIY